MIALPDAWIPLAVGTGLVLGGMALVLWPLLNDGSLAELTPAPSRRRAGPVEEASDGAVAALREIEFDRATGKLSDSDYTELKARYTSAALAELRAADAANAAHAAETSGVAGSAGFVTTVELAIRRAKANQKSCTSCGPRTEPDAIYCSNCGKYLPGSCGRCGATVEMPGSRFCVGCGGALAVA
ncbi:MAG: zinc ribbon domain-containing protein [Gemmatimonadota bacterium]